jgi:UDP-N-acetylmuramoyl-tripeptide--D-alanyl-D-alanine ligase
MQNFLDTMFLMLAQIYLSKGKHSTVVVTGSVGKTSVTQAVATVLSEQFTTKVTKGNYNTHRGVPLTIFDMTIPANRFGWLQLLLGAIWKAFTSRPTFEMLVLELGSDKPGDIEKFAFLKPQVAIVTAVTPEHMEYFKTLDAVAKEELQVAQFAEKVLVNAELVQESYISTHVPGNKLQKYGKGTQSTVRTTADEVVISLEGTRISSKDFNLVGSAGTSTLLAAAVAGKLLGMDGLDIKKGLSRIRPVAGRMNRLTGLNGSVIIDDTYNSSPEAVRSALDYLYAQKATRRIALLGMMNEMGGHSRELHEKVGSWCDPKKLDLVVTLGQDANTYLAKKAEENGCKVLRAESPRQAGEAIASRLVMGAVVLAKGSQNGVYAEEAVKLLLSDTDDVGKLVRQTGYWPKKKGALYVTL